MALTNPTNVVGTALSPTSVKVTWTNGNAAGRFQYVQVGYKNITASDAGFTAASSTIDPTLLEYTVTGLVANNEYEFQVTFLGAAEVTTITTVADVTGDLNSTYFSLHGATGEHYFWLDVDSGGTAPALPPSAGNNEVDITADELAADVAAALVTSIDAEADFIATRNNNIITVVDSGFASRTDASDSGSTGFTISVVTSGGTNSSGAVTSAQRIFTHPSAAGAYFAAWIGGGTTPSAWTHVVSISGSSPFLRVIASRIADDTRLPETLAIRDGTEWYWGPSVGSVPTFAA